MRKRVSPIRGFDSDSLGIPRNFESVALSSSIERLSEPNTPDSHLSASEGLTQRRRRNILDKEIVNEVAAERLQRAKKILRGLLVWVHLKKSIKTFGTSSHLIGASSVYKKNLHELLARKRIPPPNMSERQQQPSVCLILPDSRFQQIWNLLLLLLLFYVFIATPWMIAFEEVTIGSGLFYLELCVDILFFCDIIITMNTAYVHKEVLVTQRKKIFMNYFKGLFLIDVLAIFPFYLFENSNSKSNSLVRIIRITKVARVFRASKLLKVLKHIANTEWVEDFMRIIRTYEGIARLMSAVFIMLILAHFTACMWYFTAKIEGLGPDTWVVRHGFADSSKGILYMAGFYWAFTILTTVGFGDIHAFTTGEMVLCIIWMLFGIGFYSLLVGTLTSVLSSIDARNSDLNERLNAVTRFAEKYQLEKAILKEMKKETVENAGCETMSQEDRLQILEVLPKNLQKEICLNMNNSAVTEVPFLHKQDTVFITNIVPRLEYVQHPHSYIIYRKRDHPDAVYFVVRGRVNFVIGQEDTVFKSIIRGGYFGEIELIEDTLRMFTVMTEETTYMLVMNKDVFKEVWNSYSHAAQELKKSLNEKKQRDLQAMKETIDLFDTVMIKKQASYKDLEGTVVRKNKRRATSSYLTGNTTPSSPLLPQVSKISTDLKLPPIHKNSSESKRAKYSQLKSRINRIQTLMNDIANEP